MRVYSLLGVVGMVVPPSGSYAKFLRVNKDTGALSLGRGIRPLSGELEESARFACTTGRP